MTAPPSGTGDDRTGAGSGAGAGRPANASTATGPSEDDTLTNPAELSADTPADAIRIPARLQQRYEIRSQLRCSSPGVMLLRAEDREADRDVVLKLQGGGLGDIADVLRRIQAGDPAHLVQLYDYGTADGIGFQVLEYLPYGDLDQHLTRAGGRLAEPEALDVLRELASAISALHNLNQPALVHGDLTPRNVLVRTSRPLDLVLADFGRAGIHQGDLSDYRGTPRWASPDAMSHIFHQEGDWWSLGAIMHWCLVGRPVMADMEESAAVGYLQDHNVDLAELAEVVGSGYDRDWVRLCQGLLTRDEFDRWGSAEIEHWLAGEDVPVGEQWQPKTPIEPIIITEPVQPDRPVIRFAGTEYHSLAELGVALARYWAEAADLVSSEGSALRALIAEQSAHDGDLDLAADIGAILDSDDHVDLKLIRVIRRLSPESPVTYRGWDVTIPGLAALGDAAAADPAGAQAKAVRGLANSRALAGLVAVDSRYAEIARAWDAEMDTWRECWDGRTPGPTGAQVGYARGRILAALSDQVLARGLTEQARDAGGKPERGVDWFGSLRQRIGRSPGVAVAVIQLAPLARREAEEAEQRRRAEENQRAAERVSESMLRTPRTSHLLGYAISVQFMLAAVWLALRVMAPNDLGIPSADTITWWLTEVPGWLQPWLALWSDPLVVLPLLAVSVLLWRRSKRTTVMADGESSDDTAGDEAGGSSAGLHEGPVPRSPWERRAMQGAIGLTTMLVPVLLPFTIIGWVRGLQQWAPPELRGRDRLRGWSLAAGIATTGLGVLLWFQVQPSTFSAWQVLHARPALTGWLMRQGEEARQALSPVTVALSPQRPRMRVEDWQIWLTWLVVLAGIALLVLAARAYQQRAAGERTAMGWLLPLGIVGMISLPLAYLPISRSDWVNWLWVGVVALVLWRVLRRLVRRSR